MTVAVYEPLILKWVSGWTIHTLADVVAWRAQKAKRIDLNRSLATAIAVSSGTRRPPLPSLDVLARLDVPGAIPRGVPVDAAGNPLPEGAIHRLDLPGFPDAVAVGGRIYPHGVLEAEIADAPTEQPQGVVDRLSRISPIRRLRRVGNAGLGLRTVPTTFGSGLGGVDPDFDFRAVRADVLTTMLDAARTATADDAPLGREVTDALRKAGIYEFFPRRHVAEGLSPIGVAHFYRQLYFNVNEGFGPIEEAFTVAPLETLEVVYQVVRRQIHEELIELGSEVVSETAIESKNTEEVSDKVSSMIQRDSSSSMSANASGSIGVWEAGASASAEFRVSSQRSREEATRRLKEITQRASERITKTFSIKTRDIDDVTTTNLTRRVIRNDSQHPVSYGLRRVLRRVLVKVQDLGPRLVWQLYVRSPGDGLARSRFVHFREAEPIAIPDVPPGLPPRPKGGTDTGQTSSTLEWDKDHGETTFPIVGTVMGTWYAPVVVQCGADRIIKSVSIDSITDLEGGGKDDPAPSPRNDLQWPAAFEERWDENSHTYTLNIAVNAGDARSIAISYTYTWDPSGPVMDEWEAARQQAVAKLTQEALNEQFERQKALITERSRIRTRPPADLRREERYEVMSRMVSHLFARGDDPSEAAPLEIEYFHRYFDIDGMFTYTHPSWWKPRYAPVTTALERPAYEITAESEPAKMGSSLGWLIQLDGDTRRNEFINSPWARVCLPLRPGREREAIAWLARHVEGDIGYDTNADPLRTLLTDIEGIRATQEALGVDGPDYVTVDSAPSQPAQPNAPLAPEDVFPIVNQFEVTVPTDGFVYDELDLV
jgi:hypothetical protein